MSEATHGPQVLCCLPTIQVRLSDRFRVVQLGSGQQLDHRELPSFTSVLVAVTVGVDTAYRYPDVAHKHGAGTAVS